MIFDHVSCIDYIILIKITNFSDNIHINDLDQMKIFMNDEHYSPRQDTQNSKPVYKKTIFLYALFPYKL